MLGNATVFAMSGKIPLHALALDRAHDPGLTRSKRTKRRIMIKSTKEENVFVCLITAEPIT